jgi:pyochelin synthetase
MSTKYMTAAKAGPHESTMEVIRNSSVVARAPKPVTLHGLFEAQEGRTPSAVAVVCGDRQLTYRQLNERSRAVARAMTRAGVRQGSFVGLCVNRSLEMAVGLLGIVRAGGTYVPLDPLYPADRLAFMAADTEIQVLLTERDLVSQLARSPARVIRFDEVPEWEPNDLDERTDVEVGGEDLAYVIYTSGSTGRPKGVMIEHAAAVNTIDDMNRRFAVGPADRVLSVSSYGFDLTVYDLFGLWAVGGTVVIPEPAGARQPSHWAQLLRRHQVTIWNSVPAAMAMLVAELAVRPDGALDSLRVVLLSGDCLPTTLPDRVRAFNPGAQIINLYGATEASIWSVVHPVGRCDPQLSCVPLGTAMDNQSFHVLNESLEACGPGETGQLYLGGVGLARGYLRRAELTAERFITNPLGDQSGARLYATGDLGRMRDDGTVEFLGRIDGQVKIHGFRVETGEVEAALCRHPAIREAVVVAKEHLSHKQLVAHVVPSRQPAATVDELRDFLRQALPDYMVPTRFVMRDCLPLTDNNKVDRAALAAAAPQKQPSAEANCGCATNEVERRLARILADGFELESISPDDNFFDLGGDSLLAAGFLAQVDQEFGQALSLDVLLERPTIRLLAELLRSPPKAKQRPTVVTIQAGQSGPPLFCLPGIGGNVVEFRLLANRLGPVPPIYAVPSAGLDDHETPHQTIGEMAAHAVRQMRAIQPRGPYYLAGYSLGGVVAFEAAQQLLAEGDTTALLAVIDSRLWRPPIALSIRQKIWLHWRNLRRSTNHGRWQYLCARWRVLIERIRRKDLRRVEEDLVAGLDLSSSSRKVARVHWHAWRHYEPRVYDATITLFVAQQDPNLSNIEDVDDPTLGWSRWTTKGVKVYRTGGLHSEILRAKELEVLALELRGCASADGQGDAGRTNHDVYQHS